MEAGTPLKRTGKAGEQRHDNDLRQRLADEKQLTGSLKQQLAEACTQRMQAEANLKKSGERLQKAGLKNAELNELLEKLQQGTQTSTTAEEQRGQLKRDRGEGQSTEPRIQEPEDDSVTVVQRKVLAAQIRELEFKLARFVLRTVECDGWCDSGVKFRRRIGGLIRDLEEAREQLGEQEHMMEWMRQIPRTCGKCGDREREVERMQQWREEEEAVRVQQGERSKAALERRVAELSRARGGE
jgi:hypothetical protein